MARTYIAEGIWREGNRLYAEARSGRGDARGREKKSWALGTNPAVLKAWRLKTQSDLLEQAPAAVVRGTLAADFAAWVAKLPTGDYRDATETLLAHWAVAFGTQPRHALTRLDIIGQISSWLDAGVASSSCNHRLSRLRRFYQEVDGITTPNPTDEIKFKRGAELEARSIPMHVVKLILAALPDRGKPERGQPLSNVSHTKLRLTVMAWTGIPPVQIARLRRRDIDLEGARIYLRPRRKGKGADYGVWVALLPPAIDALKAFLAADLLGKRWSNSSARKTWRTGITRAKQAAAAFAKQAGDDSWASALTDLPPNCRPYDLRHAFASEVYRLTGDIRAVSELLQHSNLETTKRYTKGAVSERVKAAIATVAKALPTLPTMDAPPAAKRPRRGLRLVNG